MPKVMKVCSSEIFVGLILVLWFGLPLSNGSSQDEQHFFRHNNNNNNKQHYNGHRTEEYQKHQQQVVSDLKNSQVERPNITNVYLRHHNHHHLNQHINRVSNIHRPGSTEIPLAKHHLRHYNRHHQTWEQRVFPSLRHQQTTITPSRNNHPNNDRHNLTANPLRTRYFDRDSIYDARNELTTQGPKSSNSYQGSSRKFISQNQRRNDLVTSDSTDNQEFMSQEKDSVMLNDQAKSNSKLKLKQKDSTANFNDYYDDDNNNNSIRNEDDDDGNDDDDDDDDADNNSSDNNDDDDNDEEDDDDYSDEDDEAKSYDETTNRVDNRNLLKRQNNNFDTEDIYSRSYIPGTLTRYKYEMFGTHEAVEKSRMSHITNQKQHRALANAHATKVYMEAACKYPKPRIEKIQKDPSKVYVPHCTILHRCADDTGCCSTESHTCVAKRTQNVDLYFFVKTFGSKQGTVEKHTFINHTECHCVDKAKHLKYPSAPAAMLRQATILDCTCPKLFEKVLQEDGFCRCDCSSSNSGCDWLKRGMEHFSVIDRKCINEGRCKPPTCEFGTYIKKHGRCPKKDDKLMSYSRGFL